MSDVAAVDQSTVRMMLGSACICAECGPCGLTFEAHDFVYDCPECGQPGEFDVECSGCWDYEYIWFVDEWDARFGGRRFTVEGRDVGWERCGFNDVVGPLDGDAVLAKLMVNGEFMLRAAFDSDGLTVVRTSHDELGACFVFRAVGEQDPVLGSEGGQ
jgi:hypothetical protein